MKSAKYADFTANYIFQLIAVKNLGPINSSALSFLNNLGQRICTVSSNDREALFGNAENARQENAGLEFGGQICRAGKCRTGKCRKTLQCWEMQYWKMQEWKRNLTQNTNDRIVMLFSRL